MGKFRVPDTTTGPSSMGLAGCLPLLIFITLADASDLQLTRTIIRSPVGHRADKKSQITWGAFPNVSSLKVSEEHPTSSGLELFFKLERSFVRSSLKDEVILEKGAAIGLGKAELSEILTYGVHNWKQLATSYMGFLLSIIIGVLFFILFPIIGCCFCCCRCCGNCGGKMIQKTSSKSGIKRKVFAFILFAAASFTGSGALCMFLTSQRLIGGIRNMGNSIHTVLDDSDSYAKTIVTQIDFIGNDSFKFVQEVIFRDLDSIGYLLGIPVKDELDNRKKISQIFREVKNLGTSINLVSQKLLAINSSIDEVKQKTQMLAEKLNQSKTSLDKTLANCSNVTAGVSCPNTGDLSMDFDSNQMPDISSQIQKIEDATKKDITSVADRAAEDFNNIPGMVQNETLSKVMDKRVRNGLRQIIHNIKDQVMQFKQKFGNFMDMGHKFKNSVTNNKKVRSIADFIKKFVEVDGKAFISYGNYALIALSSIAMLVTALQIFGVLFGILGHRSSSHPTDRGCLSNSGGDMLMASVGFIFLFGWLMMFLTTLLFLVGAPIERYGCHILRTTDAGSVDKILNLLEPSGEGFIGSYLFKNKSIKVTVAEIMTDCRAKKGIYKAFRLKNMFDLRKYADYKKAININKTIGSINMDFSSLIILTPELTSQLANLKKSLDINYTSFNEELNQNITRVDLNKFVTDLVQFSVSIPPGQMQLELNASAANISSLRDNEFVSLNHSMSALKSALKDMEQSTKSLPADIDNIVNKLNETEVFIKSGSIDVVKSALSLFVNRLTGVLDSFVDFAINSIENGTVANCGPIVDIYDYFVIGVVCNMLVDSLNGFWFAMGWCIFFFVLGLIFSVKLAKYYRKMRYLEDFDKLGKRQSRKTSLNRKPKFAQNKVAHSDDW